MMPSNLSAEPNRLALRIRDMIKAGRPAAARPMLRVLRGLDAPAALIAELDARLSMLGGDSHGAAALLAKAIEAEPNDPGLHACRAEALLRLDQPEQALIHAADAVLLAPHAADAKALLGIVLIEAGQPGDAARCLSEALEADPHAASYRLALAEALHRLGRPDDALFLLRDGIRLAPRELALRRAALLHAVRASLYPEAIELGQAARVAGVLDASILGLTGHALGALGRHEEAFTAYADAFRLDPADAYVGHLAAAGGTVPAGPRAPADYVRIVFDGYAERFDTHLVSLGYRVPGLIRAVLEAQPDRSGPVTDLGCGTGLLAVAAHDLAGPWTGVDLSGPMLDHARDRNLYDRLVQGELTEIMEQLPSAGIVLAGDVLCYFGALDAVLLAMRVHLRPGGYAVFSLEAGSEPFAIGRNGRYSHGRSYLGQTARDAGFTVLDIQDDVLRFERGEPVPGFVVTLQSQA